ncbi:MAG: hypothetical protein FJZ56_04475 [Chlamydiae bacterium]|nr:hypothetical protein [Chlamydiota bacterium]
MYKHGILETIPLIRAISIQNILSDYTREADAHIPVERVFLVVGYASLQKGVSNDTEHKAVFITLHAVAVITALVAFNKEPSRFREIMVSIIAGVSLGYLAAKFSDAI